MDQVRFRARQPLVMRLSTLSGGAGSIPSPAVADDGSADRMELTAYLLALAENPVLREAVHVASGSLSGSLDELAAGRELTLKKLTGMAISLTRYALRMRTRATPFGLFAGVTTVDIGTGAGTAADDAGSVAKSVGLDGQWLHETVAGWLRNPLTRRRVDVVTNNLAVVRDARLSLSWPVTGAPLSPDESAPRRETSVRVTPFVTWVLRKASVPVPYASLLHTAVREFGDYSEDEIDRVLTQLTLSGFLVTSLTPLKTGGDYWERVTETVVGDDEGAFRQLSGPWSEFERAAPGEGRPAWDRAMARLRDISPEVTPQLRVDAGVARRLTVPPAVVREVEDYASSMWRIAPEAEPRPHLREYADRFKDRYGAGASVPLAEVVDPHRGLGYPRGYRGADWHGDAVTPTATTGRRVLLGELVQEALHAERREITLTDALIDELSDKTSVDAPLPSMELCLQVLSPSAEHLRDGDYRLLTPPLTGAWLAGASTARFGDLLRTGGDLCSLVESGAAPGSITAEVVFAPRVARALNVVQTPTGLLPYEIPLGTYADSREAHVIDWRDLLVTAAPSGLELIWARTGQRVVPVVAHMLELESGAPDLARLLNEIRLSQVKPWYAWRWAGLETLPVLPRVTRGRTIVSPMRWRPNRHMRDDSRTWAEWNAALDTWRDRYGVPNEIRVMYRDQAQCLDLDDAWHRKLFRHELRRGEVAVFEDLTEGGRQLGWSDGHNNELVVPLIADTGVAAPARPATPRSLGSARKAFHFPGGDWLYAKFFAVPESQDQLVAHHIPRLVREVAPHIDSWFYLRFNDPQPHIRLRMRGEPSDLAAHVLPALERHARELKESGAIASVQLDTYEPETQRYGGPDAIAHAEEVFSLDSRSAAAQVARRLRDGRDSIPDEVLAAMNYAMFLESLGPWDWTSWVARTLRLLPDHAWFRQHRRLAIDLVAPGRAVDRTAEAVRVPGLRDLWTQSPAVRTYGSLLGVDAAADGMSVTGDALLAVLHMQHNRLIGINRTKETRSYAVLRGVALAHQEKIRRGLIPSRT